MSSCHFITLQKLFVEARFILIEISGKVDNSSSHYDSIGWRVKPAISNWSGQLWHLLACEATISCFPGAITFFQLTKVSKITADL